MAERTVEEKVKGIIADIINTTAERLKPETNIFDDLGADSLDGVELTMALEEEFKIEISDEDAELLKTVGQIVDYIKEKRRGSE